MEPETGPPATREILAVQNLRTYYAKNGVWVRAVDGVSFSVPKHATVGIAGESGSGKTQTALSIMGLVEGAPGIVEGEIRIDDVNVLEGLHRYCEWKTAEGQLTIVKDVGACRKLQETYLAGLRGEKIAMAFQEPKASLSPYFSVGAQLRETAVARHGREGGGRDQESLVSLLARLQFGSPKQILRKYPHELSGGESQRIMLALALLGNPELLIADEPTTLLDAITEYRALELMAEFVREKKSALLLITHNLAVLNRFVDHVIIMFAGKVIEQGPVAGVINLASHACHPYTEELLRAAAALDGRSANKNFSGGKAHEAAWRQRGCCFYRRCRLQEGLSEQKRQRCMNEEPPPFKIGEGHYAACWEMEGEIG